MYSLERVLAGVGVGCGIETGAEPVIKGSFIPDRAIMMAEKPTTKSIAMAITVRRFALATLV
jgi:hypothetical protein